MEKLKKLKAVYSIFASGLIILGMILLIRPSVLEEVFCVICGMVMLLFGIVKLIGYFSRDLLQLAFQFDFAMGTVSCLIGILMLFWPDDLMRFLTVGMGLFMLVDALLRIQTAFDARTIGVERWWIILIVALITAVIGALLFLRPYQELQAVVLLIGLNLIIDGILNLYVVQSTVMTIKRRNEWGD